MPIAGVLAQKGKHLFGLNVLSFHHPRVNLSPRDSSREDVWSETFNDFFPSILKSRQMAD